MKNKLFLTSLTKAINTYLHLDAESEIRLQKLHGKAITIEFLPFHLTFQCLFHVDGVDIKTDDLIATETTIRGTPLQMMGVMMTKENRQRFFADDLVMEGNAELGQQVIDLFDELQIDWEEQLSHVVGDVPAYEIGRAVRGIRTWLQNAENSCAQNINEYIHEEKQWLPTHEALQDFFADIDELRMDVDRSEVRVAALQDWLRKDSENH